MTSNDERTRRELLSGVAGASVLGALAGCSAPGATSGGTETGTAETVDLTEHFLCVVNRDSAAHTVSVSVDPAEGESGSGVGRTVDVPPESTNMQRGLVTEPGSYTVRIQTDGTQLEFSWDVDGEEVTGVRVVFDERTVQAAAGVTGPCTLEAGTTSE